MKFIYLILLLFFLTTSSSFSEVLNDLFLKLQNANDFTQAKELEKKIWDYWISSGSNQESNKKMSQGIQLLYDGKTDKALKVFLHLCKIEPKWSEPFNKVATIKFLQKDYQESIQYIKLTLKKEPRHFGAISGLVQIYINLGKFDDALKNINYVSRIHPFIEIKKIKPLLLKRLNKREL